MLKIISNASPLIGLCSINSLDILKELWDEIIIPQAVYREAVINGAGKQGSLAIADACHHWIRVCSVKNIHVAEVLRAALDEGEAEVIALGQEIKADLLLLDNREPRMFADRISLKVIGTVGIIKLAWKKGLIKEPVEKIYELRKKGFWISNDLIEQIEKETGMNK
jgi:predicted nucleic acid-binding protein